MNTCKKNISKKLDVDKISFNSQGEKRSTWYDNSNNFQLVDDIGKKNFKKDFQNFCLCRNYDEKYVSIYFINNK